MKKLVSVSATLLASVAFAWWDHPYITRVAWDAQPKELTAGYSDFERDELCYHAMMSDYPRMTTSGDFGYFQLWDVFMWNRRRKVTDYANGGGSDEDFVRVLQAMWTETPLCSFLWAGAMMHAVEDEMSISHTALPGPYQAEWHAPCESFAHWAAFRLDGYVPRPLADWRDPAAVKAACRHRIAAVNQRAHTLWPKMKPLIDEHGIKQPKDVKLQTNERIDPYVMDFGRGVAELTADLICTFLTARKESAANTGAALAGTIALPEDPLNARRSAKVYLRTADGAATDYETLAINGRYRFRNLPAGTYRLTATRLGALYALSEPFTLKVGDNPDQNLTLVADVPLGNQVWNPTATWDLYGAGSPDRWRVKPLFNWGPLQQDYWRTSFMHVENGWSYRCGAKLRRPGVKVRFRFAKGSGGHGPAIELAFKDGELEAEMTWTNTKDYRKAKVEVVSTEKLADLIEKVWFVPVPPKGWDGVYPFTDSVPDDNCFRTSFHCEPPEPEFWQRDMRLDP